MPATKHDRGRHARTTLVSTQELVRSSGVVQGRADGQMLETDEGGFVGR